MLDHHANLERSSARWWIADAGDRLKALEAAIIAATAGYSPPDEQWGSLRARDFLNIVQDVTTWSLTNFENFKAPRPATVYYQTWAPLLPPIFLFAPSHVPARTPDKPERSMRLCVNPDDRRNAFWISLALLAADHPGMPRMGRPVDRQPRQRQIFKGQNPESGRIGMACISNATVASGVQELLLGRLRGVTLPLSTAVCEAVK
jgi:hypothetical protein